MDHTQPGADPGAHAEELPLDEAIGRFVQSKGTVGDSGRYARDSRRLLERLTDEDEDGYLAKRGVTTVEDLSVRILEGWAQYLDRRAQAREQQGEPHGITGTTAWQYYYRIRSFCEYWTERDRFEENPAEHTRVRSELPSQSMGARGDGQQFWTPTTREQIVRWMDWYFDAGLDDAQGWVTPEGAARERALIATVAYSGARGAELFRDSDNDRRDGLTWADVDFEDGMLTVLGKSDEWEDTPLFDAGLTRLEDHYRRQNPGGEDWPVWVTRHLPTLYQGAKGIDGVEDGDERLTPDRVLDIYREHGVAPPALSIGGARRVLRTHSEASAITEDGEHLKLHGARRGLGDELYAEEAETAQDVLRHESIRTTHESYADRDKGDLRDRGEEILDR